jgi:hypothetical protein
MQNNNSRLGIAVAVSWFIFAFPDSRAGDHWVMSATDEAPVFWHFADAAGRDGKQAFTITTTVNLSEPLGSGVFQKFKKNVMAHVQWNHNDACEYFGVIEGDAFKGHYTCERSGPRESEWSAVITNP